MTFLSVARSVCLIFLCALPLSAQAEVISYESLAGSNFITAQVGMIAINLDRNMENGLAMMIALKEQALQKFPEDQRTVQEQKNQKLLADMQRTRALLKGLTAGPNFRKEMGDALARVHARGLTHEELEYLVKLFEKIDVPQALDGIRELKDVPNLRTLLRHTLKESYLETAQNTLYQTLSRKINSDSFKQDLKITLAPIVQKYTDAAQQLHE
jgi:hypothetical protein